MTEAKRFLLTGGRSYVTLDLARKLRAVGHVVVAADTSTWHVSRFSNAIEKHCTFPSPRFDPEGFVAKLREILTTEKIDIMIPIWEEILCIAKHRDQLPDDVNIFCDRFEILNTLHHKWLFAKRVEELGFKAPKSTLVTCQEDLDALAFTTPFVLKPCYSRAAQELHRIYPDEPLPSLTFPKCNPWIAQEWIEGQQYSTYSVCHNGHLTAHGAYPLQISLQGYASLNFAAVDHPGIFEWTQRFVEKEKFTGQIAFDFIESKEGVLYPIECNPRSTSGLHLFNSEDRLDRAYLNPSAPLINPRPGTEKQLGVGMLMYGWRSAWHQHNLKGFLKKFFRLEDVIFKLEDPLPILMLPFLLPTYWLQSIRLHEAIPTVFNYDLEWDGNQN